MLTIKEIEGKIPVTESPITVVEGDCDGFTIRDYKNGKPVDEGIYVSSVDFDSDEILTYEYQNDTAYVANTAYDIFITMRESAQLFIKCGNYESYADALEAQMKSED